MCGICGKIDFTGSPVDEGLLRRMTDRLAHRGPDDSAVYLRHQGRVGCGLGHRRLSIIDLTEAGRQPMSNEDKTLWMVFNGEIYNFAALREELERKGHRFRSRTDSEVISTSLRKRDRPASPASSGCSPWPSGRKRRKPSFWPATLSASSRSSTTGTAKDFSLPRRSRPSLPIRPSGKEIDLEALDLYLSLNYIPAPHTIFKNIRKLRPGHFLTVRDGVLERGEILGYRFCDTRRCTDSL